MFRLAIKSALEDNLEWIDKTLNSIREEADKNDINPFNMRDMMGSWVVTPLLDARAQTLSALATLEASR